MIILMLLMWLLLSHVWQSPVALAMLIADRQSSVGGGGRGSLEDRDKEGPTALVSNWRQEDVSATGLGWLWQSGGSIKGPALIYNAVSQWTPFSQRYCSHLQQRLWRTAGVQFTLWFMRHLGGQTMMNLDGKRNHWFLWATPAVYFKLSIIHKALEGISYLLCHETI